MRHTSRLGAVTAAVLDVSFATPDEAEDFKTALYERHGRDCVAASIVDLDAEAAAAMRRPAQSRAISDDLPLHLSPRAAARLAGRRLPSVQQTALIRRIAQTGALILTHNAREGDIYADALGVPIAKPEALALIRGGFVEPSRDSMFGAAPQSWRVKGGGKDKTP
jgi:hypothetical protein